MKHLFILMLLLIAIAGKAQFKIIVYNSSGVETSNNAYETKSDVGLYPFVQLNLTKYSFKLRIDDDGSPFEGKTTETYFYFIEVDTNVPKWEWDDSLFSYKLTILCYPERLSVPNQKQLKFEYWRDDDYLENVILVTYSDGSMIKYVGKGVELFL